MVFVFVFAALLATVPVIAERDCYRGVQRMPSGSSYNTGNCERHTCRDGRIRREFCPPVPPSCTPLPPDHVKIYPFCCPNWCCGVVDYGDSCGEGADIIFGPITDLKGGCKYGGKRVSNKTAFFTESCERVICLDGVMRTSRCSPVPSGCTLLKYDSTQLYPACCPSFCCGEECGERNDRLFQPGQCISGPYLIPDGGYIQSLDCNRLSCNNGFLSQEICYPVSPECTKIPGEAGTTFPLSCNLRDWDPECVSTFVDRTSRKVEDNEREHTGEKRQGMKKLRHSAEFQCNPESETCQPLKPIIISKVKPSSKPVDSEDICVTIPPVTNPGTSREAKEGKHKDTFEAESHELD